MRLLTHTACFLTLLAAGISGCDASSQGGEEGDGSVEVADGGNETADGSYETVDGSADVADGGNEAIDGGHDLADGSNGAVDGGNEVIDGGNEAADGGLASPVARIHAEGTFEVECKTSSTRRAWRTRTGRQTACPWTCAGRLSTCEREPA